MAELAEKHGFDGYVLEHFLTQHLQLTVTVAEVLKERIANFSVTLVIPPPQFSNEGKVVAGMITVPWMGVGVTYASSLRFLTSSSSHYITGTPPGLIPALTSYVDRFSLMTYDFSGGAPQGGSETASILS